MGDVITLSSGKEFRTLKELQKYADALYLVAEVSKDKIKELEEKLRHSEDLLLAQQVFPIIKTQEQCMIEAQIDRLQTISNARQLSHEEVKTMDLLIKNKLLLSGQATTIAGDIAKKKPVTMKELVLIAQKKD